MGTGFLCKDRAANTCVELSGDSCSVRRPEELQVCSVLLGRMTAGGRQYLSEAAGLESAVDELRDEQVEKGPWSGYYEDLWENFSVP